MALREPVRVAAVTLAIALFSWCAWRSLGRPPTGIDDADITFVYAKHLTQGHGLVYNPGGERVEGYSSLLMMLIAAGVLVCHLPLEFTLIVLNVLWLSLSVWLGLRFLERSSEGRAPDSRAIPLTAPGFLYLAWLFCHPGFFSWNVLSLLETGLWTSLLTVTGLCVMSLAREITASQSRIFAALGALLVITRPEGVAWGFSAAAVVVLTHWLSSMSLRPALRSVFAPVLAVVATFGSLVLFRLAYFGYPVPNTYYAKVSVRTSDNINRGAAYLWKFFQHHPLHSLVLCASVFGVLQGLRLRSIPTDQQRWRREYFAVSMLVLIGLAFPVLEGGDHFAHFRFFQPLQVLMFFPLAYAGRFVRPALERLLGVEKRGVARNFGQLMVGAGVVLIALKVVAVLREHTEDGMKVDFSLSEQGRATGGALNRTLRGTAHGRNELPVIGVNAAGGIALEYDGTVFDMMALNDVEMAHARRAGGGGITNHAAFDRGVFFSRPPDLVMPSFDEVPYQVHDPRSDRPYLERQEVGESWNNRILKGLFVDPDFRRQYDFAVIGDSRSGPILTAYVRKSYAETLRNHQIPLVITELHPLQ